MSPLLSVVVPFYNVEGYLEACLDSLQQQTLRDIEIIMVDDGSPDASAAIAKEFADRDDRFHLVEQENQGLGPARNTGAIRATGTYLAFVDSDDVLPRYAYELMVGTLEETGSDLACGGVRRLTSAGPRSSPMHTEMFLVTDKRTHVSKRPDLLGDRTAWNKVFRKAFFDKHGFAFPPGLYEDAPVTIPAHFLASSVDVLSDTVYYWREREGESQSITQRRTEPGNLEDRVRTTRAVTAFLKTRSPELWRAQLTSVLSGELPLYIDMAGEGGSQYQERLRAEVGGVVAEADAAMLAELTALKRLKYHFIGNGMIDALLELITFQQAAIFTADVVRKGDRWYAAYPYFGDPERSVPDDLYDVTRELTMQGRADSAHWDYDGMLHISGHAYITRIPMTDPSADPDACDIRVWLRHTRNGTVVELPSRRAHRPDVSADARRAAADYDWAGFEVVIDPADLRVGRYRFMRSAKSRMLRALRSANWELHAEVTAPGGLKAAAPLRGPRRSDVRWANAWDAAPDVWIRPVTTASDRFVIQVKQLNAHITAAAVKDGTLVLDGRVADTAVTSAELVLARRQGMAETRHPVTFSAGGRFSAELPVEALVSRASETAATLHTWVTEGLDWDGSLQVPGQGKPIRLTIHDDVELRHSLGADEIVVTRTKFGNLRIAERPRRPAVTRAEWTDDGRLVLSGEIAGDERPDRLLVRLRSGGDTHAFPMAWTEDGFTAELAPTRVSRFGEVLPLSSGHWGFFAPMAEGDVAVAVSRSSVAGLPAPRVVGLHEFKLATYQADALRLEARPAQDDEERGVYGLKRTAQRDYPAYLNEPLRDMAMFESFRGRQYSDSPRAIYEELARRRPDLECVWVTKDGQFQPPDGVRTVLYGGREHFRTLAQARYLVGNDPMPEWLDKREGQFYAQTWHGTPLKRIGYDIERPKFKNAQDYMRRFSADVAQWDVLVSPNPFSTPIMRRAFRYEGEILESGYPRNDLLARGNAARATRVRKLLGIPEGRKVVLYAPTWRDDQARSGGYRMELQLDLDAARAALGGDHVLLVRGHFNLGGGVEGTDGEFAIDVSRYPDIADLYLISDLMVTDYSSVMFDYAVTGRPQLFFTYDLERYRDHLRGFYFDFEAEAPGPLCGTSAELIEAIGAAEAAVPVYADRYRAFQEKFCAWDDGGAAARVVDRMLRDG
ncbi:bifunctional glycosyltransferase/CDP-glycerol:glycerophosphate glycerophosphotransferase [Actinomadura xylanilytica]|uniref:bifunctional glycosyltransferase/CDP-glycerol:glycerophosphate glycerophosphotransferase n=1 Tax=Actinomadura xylanilytica TaxID=887459 RepID=UPI00255B0C20|nr:bifunctional glycosyltransferase/CDP-glycerol:glycerophosphate glycerophosphotransferase [Actinomadura xylanilytica]MDL4776055.1 CDP-glycerol glycerophosphotransferase family protein [Actinomadura xylanilytica]